MHVYSLEDVLMEESRLYLIFEFLSMDLKKYLDSLGPNKIMDADLVRSYLYQVNLKISMPLQSSYTSQVSVMNDVPNFSYVKLKLYEFLSQAVILGFSMVLQLMADLSMMRLKSNPQYSCEPNIKFLIVPPDKKFCTTWSSCDRDKMRTLFAHYIFVHLVVIVVIY